LHEGNPKGASRTTLHEGNHKGASRTTLHEGQPKEHLGQEQGRYE